MRGRRPRWA